MKIKLNYQDRKFFHPFPSSKMLRIIKDSLSKLNWQIDIPPDKLTRDEAKELIKKGIQSAKRKGIRLLDVEKLLTN